MRIVLACNHLYPVDKQAGTGKSVTTYPSGSGNHQHDLLARGLAEAGHTVFYYIQRSKSLSAIPEGIQLVDHLPENVDIVHLMARVNKEVADQCKQLNIPLIETNHLYKPNEHSKKSWVYVSKTLSDMYGGGRFVWCGLDPDNYLFSEKKEDYFLFISDISRSQDKGLDIALELAQRNNIRLVVAGSAREQETIHEVEVLCEKFGADYIGDVRGEEKARLFAYAKALISPSKLSESFGITLAEALFSGTPVICSDKGAYPEIISPNVGCVCSTSEDYDDAIKQIERIDPYECAKYANKHFHYTRTTKEYISIYKEELTIPRILT